MNTLPTIDKCLKFAWDEAQKFDKPVSIDTELLIKIIEYSQGGTMSKKELKTSNSLDEVRAKNTNVEPEPYHFKLESGDFCDGWDWLILPGGGFGYYNRKAYLKALQEWEEQQ